MNFTKLYITATSITALGLAIIIILASLGFTSKFAWCEPFQIETCTIIPDKLSKYYRMKLQVSVGPCNATAVYTEITSNTNCINVKLPGGFLCYLADEEKCMLDARTFNLVLLSILIGSLVCVAGVLFIISLTVIKHRS